MTMTEQRVNTKPQQQEQWLETKNARIAVGEPLVDNQVRVIGGSDDSLLGKVGTLLRIDRPDSNLTFLVRLDGQGEQWVYEIEAADVPAAVDEVLGVVDGEAHVGDTVKVLAGLPGASEEYNLAAVGKYAEVVGGEIVGGQFWLKVRSDEITALSPGEFGRNGGSVASWQKVLRSASEVAPVAVVADGDPKDVEIARLTASLQEARREPSRSERRLESLKEDVGRKVRDLTRENGWCSVAKEAMEDLGIDVPTSRVRFTVVYEVTVEATPKGSSEPSDSFIRDSISFDEPTLDSDWEDQEVVETSIRVTASVEDVD